MAHREQLAFVQSAYAAHPGYFRNTRVLEVGSRIINGTVRDFFTGCEYVGIDSAPGSGVDVVTLAHDYDPEGRSFDCVVCCEVLEHDPHVSATIRMMTRVLTPGGLLIVTAAGPARREHGTPRTSREGDGRDYGPQPDFYCNVRLGLLVHALQENTQWQELVARYARDRRDVYLWAISDDADDLAILDAARGN